MSIPVSLSRKPIDPPPGGADDCANTELTVAMPANWTIPAEVVAEQAILVGAIGPGTQLGEYHLGERIGIGGCGAVYRAAHAVLGTPAAVKVLHHDLARSPEMVERFLREMRAANTIRHPNIVDIWGSGELGHRPYFVMELLGGTSLRDVLRAGTLSPAEALEIMEPVCGAVGAAHAVGIVHRDLKASNIMVCDDADGRRIKLLDFGIAKLTQSDGQATALTAVGRKLGTPSSMSPEQILGRGVDLRTDIYALGVMLFHMLTCRYPFESDDASEIERMHLRNTPPSPSEHVAVGGALDAVVLRCLEKQPQHRYESVTGFVLALRHAVENSRCWSAPKPVVRSELAAAILIEVVLADPAQDTMDEATVEDLINVLETAQQLVLEGGLRVALQTGSATLGIIALPVELDAQRPERVRLIEHAIRCYRALDQRAGKQPGVGVTVRTYVKQANLRRGAQPGVAEITGPILSISEPAAEPPCSGLYVSIEMLQGIEIPPDKLLAAHMTIVGDGPTLPRA